MTTKTHRRRKNALTLPEKERQLLEKLHLKDGAWTHIEASKILGEDTSDDYMQQGLLDAIFTEIGPLLMLTKAGQLAVFGNLKHARSLEKQQNKAYFRLALKALGWRLVTENDYCRGLEDYDKTGNFREVITHNGNALVSAKLTANGYSRQHYKNVVKRLKSTALYEDFLVILITPNITRGRKIIEKNESFMSTVLYRPAVQDTRADELIRLTRPRPHTEAPDPGPYLAGKAWKTDPRFTDLPKMVLNILQKNRAERVAEAIKSIKVDGAMSAAMLKRFYGLKPADLPRIWQVRTYLRATPTQATSEVRVTFLTFSKRLAKLDDHRLGHRCGTGCMRHLLNVPADSKRWQAEYRGRLKLEEPDALYLSETGEEMAVEFDSGTYTKVAIDKKMGTFEDRGLQVIWGVSNVDRQQKMTAEIGAKLAQKVLLAQWWM